MQKPGDEPVPGYRLEQFLGKGQYGEVWRARSPGGAKAALKFLDLGGRAGWKEFRAIQRVKAIRHANLMPITALWVLDDQGQLVDDEILDSFSASDSAVQGDHTPQASIHATLRFDGGAHRQVPRQLVVASLLGDRNLLQLLEHYQQQGATAIPPDELLDYMEQAAKGIDFLNMAQHDLGQGPVAIQHCDIKPENIMLVGDSVLVCDFGLASVLADARSAATATGMVGSLAYMSPECASRKPSSASDQYSLAISYIELRTGDLPFTNKSFGEVLDAVRNSKLDLSRVTPAEQQVLRRATSLDPSDRYPTAAAMVADLRRALQSTRETTAPRPTARWQVPAMLLATLVLATGLGVWWSQRPTAAVPEPQSNYTIHIEPPLEGVTLHVAGQEIASQSPGVFLFAQDDSFDGELVVDPPTNSGYASVTSRLEKNGQDAQTITLPRSAAWLRDQAYQHAATDWPQAVDQLVTALQASDAASSQIDKVPAPTLLADLQGQNVTCAVISPDRRFLVVATEDGGLHVWKLGTWQTQAAPTATHRLRGPVRSANCLAVGKRRLVASYTLENSPVSEVAIIADWETPADPPPYHPVEAILTPPVAITHDEQVWTIANEERQHLSQMVRLELTADQQIKAHPVPYNRAGLVSRITLSPDERVALVINDSQAEIWPLTGQREPRDVPAEESNMAFALPDAFCIDSMQVDGYHIELRDWNTLQPTHTLDGFLEDPVVALGIDRQRTQLAAGDGSGTILIWSLQTPQASPRTLIAPVKRGWEQIVFGARPGWLLTLDESHTVALWNLEKGLNQPVLLSQQSRVVHLDLTDDGHIVVVSQDGKIWSWPFDPCALLRDALEKRGAREAGSAQASRDGGTRFQGRTGLGAST